MVTAPSLRRVGFKTRPYGAKERRTARCRRGVCAARPLPAWPHILDKIRSKHLFYLGTEHFDFLLAGFWADEEDIAFVDDNVIIQAGDDRQLVADDARDEVAGAGR